MEEFEAEGFLPVCVDPEEDEPCPYVGLELWPVNQDALDAYGHVGSIVQPAFSGLGPLDMAGVIQTLDYLGLSPEDPDERAELLAKLQIIHSARLEAALEEDKEQGVDD